MMKFLKFFVMIFYFLAVMLSFGETEAPLKKAESLITELKFYEAMIALEPLLMNREKSQAQEQALWIANTLGVEVAENMTAEQDALRVYPDYGSFSADDPRTQRIRKKREAVDRLEADIHYSEMAGAYIYRYGFLERLLALYPKSRWAPIAEYYLIHKNRPLEAVVDVEKTISVLLAYVKKYTNSGYFEVSMAYYDIARLYHGIWADLAYPELSPERSDPIGDAANAKERAAFYKTEALKYYAKFIVGDYQETRWRTHEMVRQTYQDLKHEKNVDQYFLYYD